MVRVLVKSRNVCAVEVHAIRAVVIYQFDPIVDIPVCPARSLRSSIYVLLLHVPVLRASAEIRRHRQLDAPLARLLLELGSGREYPRLSVWAKLHTQCVEAIQQDSEFGFVVPGAWIAHDLRPKLVYVHLSDANIKR